VANILDRAEDLYNQSQQGKINRSQYLDGSMVLYIGAVAKLFGQNPVTYEQMYWTERQRGLDPQQALGR